MKAINKLRKRRAVSPVIATVILVAVAITVAVAVAYWMGGIAGQYTKFEKVEIQSALCTQKTGYWEIVILLKNSGTKTATLTSVFVNDVLATLGTAAPTTPAGSGITALLGIDPGDPAATPVIPPFGCPLQVESGVTDTVTIWIESGVKLSSGTTVNIKIHSAGGMDYIKLTELV